MAEATEETRRQGMRDQVVIARVGSTEYGIDIGAVIEILPYANPTPIPGAPMNVLGLLRVRERTVPIVELASALGDYATRGAGSRIVIISLPESHVGFVVDDVVEVLTIPEDSLHATPPGLGDNPFVRGVVRIEERLVLQLDYTAVVSGGLNASANVSYSRYADAQDGATGHERGSEDDADAGLTEADIALVEESWKLLAQWGPELVDRFYGNLFAAAPGVRDMFPDDVTNQKKALLGALGAVLANIRNPEQLVGHLEALGQRHAAYGAEPAHYDAVRGVLLSTMFEMAGDAWSAEYERAWDKALTLVGSVMVGAAERIEAAGEDDEEVELPPAINVEALEGSFTLLRTKADELADVFYAKLFAKAPVVRGMFPEDMAGQQRALLGSLGMIVRSLRKPAKLVSYLQELGMRHVEYGAQPAHYDVVGAVLLETLAELAGDLWNDELEEAWGTAYALVQDVMLTAATSAADEAA